MKKSYLKPVFLILFLACGCSASEDDSISYENGYNDGYSSGYEDGYVAGQEDSENIYYDSYAYYDSDIYNKGFFDGIERAMECVQLENLSSEAKEDLDYYYDTYYDYVYDSVENENLLPGLPPEVEQRINN